MCFFANISHEFRTPLTLILGPAQKLLQQTDNKENTEDINLIIRYSKRLKHLIDQLLEISKIEKGAMKLDLEESNISLFIKSILSAFETWANEKDIRIEFISNPDSIYWSFDSDKMEKSLTIYYQMRLNSPKKALKLKLIYCKLATQFN
ncbi:MAG: hypothetical protein HC831_14060 [Chloroflexia bacterium]|nr:hypothetical protein [Chloroflexia bacterium]